MRREGAKDKQRTLRLKVRKLEKAKDASLLAEANLLNLNITLRRGSQEKEKKSK
jgi:hypothetical protein